MLVWPEGRVVVVLLSRTAQVRVAMVGSARGELEMEYWRMRIGGNIARKDESGRVAVG